MYNNLLLVLDICLPRGLVQKCPPEPVDCAPISRGMILTRPSSLANWTPKGDPIRTEYFTGEVTQAEEGGISSGLGRMSRGFAIAGRSSRVISWVGCWREQWMSALRWGTWSENDTPSNRHFWTCFSQFVIQNIFTFVNLLSCPPFCWQDGGRAQYCFRHGVLQGPFYRRGGLDDPQVSLCKAYLWIVRKPIKELRNLK